MESLADVSRKGMPMESANSCFQSVGIQSTIKKAGGERPYFSNAIFHNFLGHEIRFIANQEFLDVICGVAFNLFQPHSHVFKRFYWSTE